MDHPIIITIDATIEAPVEKVWKFWTEPLHITQWNHASPDWHSPSAVNDVKEGGHFAIRMEAKDGSMGFDFGGTYDIVREQAYLEYTMGDKRKVQVIFSPVGDSTRVTESFEAEQQHDPELQRAGWQSILDNFKKYTESN